MLIKSKASNDISENEVTDRTLFDNRRQFIKRSGQIALGTALFGATGLLGVNNSYAARGEKIPNVKKSAYTLNEKLTSYEDATSYNNFYEFGTEKTDPARNAKDFKTRPWHVVVEGECAKPGRYAIEDFIKPYALEERVYRFRCVEAWSMTVPWVGFSLADMVKRFQPTSRAKYIEFVTLHDAEQMPGQRREVLNWPYVEGLRMDEAMHPLSLMVVGLYGEVLPNQNGAPLRLMVPWKYGFKNVKSIVKIRFVENQPATTWALAGPSEYGFYANVNPQVDHPRWSQKKERHLGEFLKRDTQMFNGYADQVASLYQGMDLRRFY